MTRPALISITSTPKGDGVAVVSQLLETAMRRRWGTACLTVTMFDGPARQPSIGDKVSFAVRLNSALVAERPTFAIYSHFALVRATRFVPRAFGRPYAVFLHGAEVWSPLSDSDLQLIRGAALRLANSSHTAARALAANPALGAIVACPLALPARAAGSGAGATALPTHLADPALQIVLTVGALRSAERYKGHDELIAAWPSIVAAVPAAHLLVVGDGDDRPRLEELARRSGVGGSITFTGFASDELLQACYARAAVYAMPSRGEGFGIVYLEAMSHGLPCIGSRQDAAGEVIEDGVTGLLVDQSNIASLRDAIVALMVDRCRRRQMGAAGRSRYESTYTVDAFERALNGALDAAFQPEYSFP